jgi:peptide/nickel transport system substrate-binding protein
MAAGHSVEDDGLRWVITLRDGLSFHDGEPVRAVDVAASVRRWMARNTFGQALAAVTDEITALDDRRLQIRLKRPFPLLPNALGNAGSPAFVMPERLARTDPYKQVTDTTGSGPFRFKADEYNSGSLAVYERNAAYVPTSGGAPSMTAGPKRVFFDRVEWHIVADDATAVAGLQRGELDWLLAPNPDSSKVLARDPKLVVAPLDGFGTWAMLRLNALHPPFDDPAIRRALLPAINQADFMQAIVGDDPAQWRDGVGVFTPGSLVATDVALAPLRGPHDVVQASAALKGAGYAGEPVRLIGPTDALGATPMTQVAADLFQRLGLQLDLAMSDWGTVVQRRTNREDVSHGGWSALATGFSSFDCIDPSAHPVLRGNGLAGWPGWPTIPRLETLRDDWFAAVDLPGRQAVCNDIQRVVMQEVPFIPLGSYLTSTAHRADLRDRISGIPVFWQLHRA